MSAEPLDMPLCSDCGRTVCITNLRSRDKGSSVREPGEVLCLGCSAYRTKMVRELDAIPGRLGRSCS